MRKRNGARERRSEGATQRGRQLFLSLTLSPSRSVALLLFLSLVASAAAHKFHFSFTQIEYNAQEKTAAITLRVFADDLENALSQRSGKAVKLDHKDAAALAAAYVRDTVELKGRDGRIKKLMWIGMETKVDVALLYVEAKLPEGMTGLQLRQRVFFELFDDQVNQVSLKAADRKASLEFKSGEGFKTLSFGAK